MAYNTKQRQLILNYLISKQDSHVTASDIISHLYQNNTRVGTATVYRFLEMLVSDGKVRRYNSKDGACFQWAGGECADHYHFICNKCGNLYHIECESLDKISSHISERHGFKVDMSNTVFCGECAGCAEGGAK